MPAESSWEDPARDWDRPEAATSDVHWEDSGDEAPLESLSSEECQTEFAKLLTDMYVTGALSAKSLCLVCYWAMRSGAKGPIVQLGMAPTPHTGHYQRHLDSVLRLKETEAKMHRIAVPVYSKNSASRESTLLEVLPPHEAIWEETTEDPTIREEFEAQLRNQEWGAAYKTHPVTQGRSKGEVVFPMALFVDGLPFTNRDSLLAFYSYNLATGKRHLNAVLRKSSTCKCGCRGWCSVAAIWRFLAWSLEALAGGRFPRTDVSGESFPEGSERADLAGKALGFKCAVVQVKGDWAEFSHSFGFASWSSSKHPCLLCDATADTMHNIDEWTLAEAPFELVTPEAYETACVSCEVKVLVSKAQLRALIPRLVYDKRQTGLKGRGLLEDYPALSLKAGDRLEPSLSVPDIGQVESATSFPLELTFWRTPCQKSVLHRMPLFNGRLGISTDSFALDLLHTLHLGIMNRYVCCCIWSFFAADIWHVRAAGAATTEAEATQLNVLRLRADLWDWYRARQRSHPSENLTRLEDITPGMLGSAAAPLLKAKGAETKGLLFYVVGRLGQHATNVERGMVLKAAGEELIKFLELIDSFPPVLSIGQQQDCQTEAGPF